jgi:hypothetical protein
MHSGQDAWQWQRGQQPMQSPFPRKRAGMLEKRLIDTTPITRAMLDTLQPDAGFIDQG